MAENDWRDRFQEEIIKFLVTEGTLVQELIYGRYSGWADYGPTTGWEHNCDNSVRMLCASTEETCEICGASRPPASEFPTNHVAACGIDLSNSRYEDSEWTEFDGTFAEPQFGTYKGIDAVVSCTCGKVQNRHWRYTGSHAEMLRAITG